VLLLLKQYKSLLNKRLALNYFLFALIIIATTFAIFFANSSSKYQSKIDELNGRLIEINQQIEIKEKEALCLKVKIDSLKNEALKPDTVEIYTIKYYEDKKREVLNDSAHIDLDNVRTFLRSVKLPD
jgi:Na+/citrate or Na+/malate symporter